MRKHTTPARRRKADAAAARFFENMARRQTVSDLIRQLRQAKHYALAVRMEERRRLDLSLAWETELAERILENVPIV